MVHVVHEVHAVQICEKEPQEHEFPWDWPVVHEVQIGNGEFRNALRVDGKTPWTTGTTWTTPIPAAYIGNQPGWGNLVAPRGPQAPRGPRRSGPRI